MLVKYECGCVGEEPGKDGLSLILQRCDSSKEIGLSYDAMSGKEFTVLPFLTQEALLIEVNALLNDGDNLRAIKGMLQT
jgi:hypothetical protein